MDTDKKGNLERNKRSAVFSSQERANDWRIRQRERVGSRTSVKSVFIRVHPWFKLLFDPAAR